MKTRVRTPAGSELDRLGRIGENHFEQLCLRAGLHCARLEPDRTGKDFVVEFPLDPFDAMLPYDKRPAPLQVVVQVKTVTAPDRPAVLALSVAERLARDLRPAIVCLLVHDEKLDDIVAVKFIHLARDNLERVLRALRQAQKRGKRHLHKVDVTFSQGSAFEVGSTKELFRDAFRGLAAKGMAAYAREKQSSIDTAGYGSDRIVANFEVSAVSRDRIVDAFLGLVDLPAVSVSIKERRFGIDLPLKGESEPFADGRLRVEPQSLLACKLLLSTAGRPDDVSVEAELFAVPVGLAGDAPVSLLRWAMGRIRIDPANRSCNVRIDIDLEARKSVSKWREEFHFIEWMLGLPCSLRVEGNETSMRIGQFEWPASERPDWLPDYMRLLETYHAVFSLAGIEESFSLDFLVENRAKPSTLAEMLRNSVTLTGRSDDADGINLTDESGLFVASVEWTGLWIGLAMPMRVSATSLGGVTDWRCTKSGNIVLERLGDASGASFERFRARAMSLANPRCCLTQNSGGFMTDKEFDIQVLLADE